MGNARRREAQSECDSDATAGKATGERRGRFRQDLRDNGVVFMHDVLNSGVM